MLFAIIDLICAAIVALLLLFMSAAIALYNLNEEQRRNGK